MMSDDRRVRLLPIRTSLLADILGGFKNRTCWRISDCDELPEGYQVIDTFHDPHMRSIMAVIHHESFPPVPCGERIPVICGVHEATLVPVDIESMHERVRAAGIERERLKNRLQQFDLCKCGKRRFQHTTQYPACRGFRLDEPADDLETIIEE